MILALIYIIGHGLYIVYYAIGLYHWNPFIELKPLSPKEKSFIGARFPIYQKLPKRLKDRCDARIIWFRSRKKFVFYGNVEREAELTLILSATAVLMTLGLKNYKMMRSVLRIIVYPSPYYSRINKRHHLGEYNPRLKTVIFSAEKIWEGFAVADDNKNLAIHELAHALSFEMIKKSSWEARRFRVGINKIKDLFKDEDFRNKLILTQYFREYGMTNLNEFFSVAVENYFETPSIFHYNFPTLFKLIRQMLNFDYEIACIFNPPKT